MGATKITQTIAYLKDVSILARPEERALQSAYNVMTFNVEKRTLREPSVFKRQRVPAIKKRRQKSSFVNILATTRTCRVYVGATGSRVILLTFLQNPQHGNSHIP